ncbi:MAG: HD domain-containing protein [Spirochaetales bacterium]|nr:HD domain-containing protein [Spirochaetales bacterium]
MKRFLFLLFAVLISSYTASILFADVSNNIISGKGYSCSLYNVNEGYPVSGARAIVQTSDGFIWIGDYSGLFRFDGRKFEIMRAENLTSVISLFADTQNRLWIGSNDRGLAMYQNGNFTSWGKDSGIKSFSVKTITEDNNGNIIFGTRKGLYYIDKSLNLHEFKDERVSSQYIRNLDCDPNGRIAGNTSNGDIFIIQDLSITNYFKASELDIPKVRSIFLDKNKTGKIYIGTVKNIIGIMDLDSKEKELNTFSTGELRNINKVYPEQAGNLWICADNGIECLTKDGDLVKLHNSQMDNSVENMMIDYESNLWFVSSRQGVMKIVENPFNNISQRAGLSNFVVNAIAKYHDNLYIGTDTGLHILDKNNQIIENKLTSALAKTRIRSISVDSKDNIWICTFSNYGLLKSDSNFNITSINTDKGLCSNRVRSMIEMSNGNIAVASDGGVNIIKDDKVIAKHTSEDGLFNNSILSICEGKDGVIYAGSDGGGIYIIHPTGIIINLTEENGLKSGVILQIKKDPDQPIYWLITGNSISYLSDDVIHNITNFPYHNNFDIFFSGDKSWILGGNGIYTLNKTDLYNNNLDNYKYYGINDGLPSYATANSKSLLDSDKMLYVAGASGVFTISLNANKNTKTNPVRLSIPQIIIDGERYFISPGEKIKIQKQCHRLTMNCYVLSNILKDQKVEYNLEGFDTQTNTTTRTKLSPITYTNLQGGKYVFHLIAKNNETNTKNNEIEFTIIKKKKFIETVWFFISMLATIMLISLLAAYIFYRIKTKRLRDKEARDKMLLQQVIAAFSKTIDYKDNYTVGHSVRVAKYTALIAKRMGFSKEEIEKFYNIAMLHDVGKLIIPDEILNKKEQLNDDEYKVMKSHTEMGYDILSNINIFPDLALGAEYHHEKIDGTGYPKGLKYEEIPISVRIISVADTYDAMGSTRSYRKGMPTEAIIEELKKASGTQLDPEIVNCILDLIKEGKIPIL